VDSWTSTVGRKKEGEDGRCLPEEIIGYYEWRRNLGGERKSEQPKDWLYLSSVGPSEGPTRDANGG